MLVDAANVVGSRPDGWWRDRAGAARRLVEQVQHAGLTGRVVLVLEGAARPEVPPGCSHGVEVVHAPGPGDDALVDLCAPGTLLVTADRELARRARERGAGVVGPRWLLEQVTPAPPAS